VKNSLDLSINGILSIKDSKQIDLLEPVVRTEYNEYIGLLVESNNVSGLQWLLRVICRNTDNSMLYHWLCKLSLLEFKLQQGEVIHNIVIDHFPLESSINQLFNRYHYQCTIDVLDKKNKRLFNFSSNLAKNLYHSLNNYLWGRVFSNRVIPEEEILLLDTFFLKNTINNGVVNDRYYPGLIDNVTIIKKENIFYLPILYGLRSPLDYFRQFKAVSKLSEKVILKEHWLKLIDYIYAIWQSIVLPKSIIDIPEWRSLDINELVKNELMQDQAGASLTQAVLIERSFMRYKQSGIKLSGVIDWFENQVVDRAVYLGLRRIYPDIHIKGYQGFIVGKGYVGLQPTQYEYDGGVLPDELLVMGDAYVEDRKKECAALSVSVAPAFRMLDTLRYNRKDLTKKDLVILAMPMLLTEASEIVDLALSIDLPKDLKFIIKVHPAISIEKFKQVVPKSVDSRIKFTNQTLSDLFRRGHLLVTAASSVALDAVLCDVPVAILGARTTYTNNPLEDIVSDEYWSVCYAAEDLSGAIKRKKINKSLEVSYYLNNVSKVRVDKMMGNF
jgi:hypothetical protein